MSEIVQRRMESMTQEFEEMCRTKLFTTDESRQIMKKRKEFEYKINGLSKNIQDFKDYIKFERYLLRDIKLRRDKNKTDEKKASLEHKIIKRVKALYETALQRFSDDVNLCLCYFKFCKQVNYIHAATTAISNLLKSHPDNPEVWKVAANYHAHDCKDISTAIKILIKGVSIHKDCQTLYTDVIELQLLHTVGPNWSVKNMESQSEEEKAKQKLCCEKLNAYCETMFLNVTDCDYYIELLELLEKYGFTLRVQNLVIEFLLREHSDKVNVWHTLAQREGKGLHYGPESEENPRSNSTKARLSLCFAKYQEGLSKVASDKKADLWSTYLDYLIELQHDNLGVANVFKASSLKSALEQAYEEGHLKEKYYMNWIDLVDDKEALEILEKGTTALPQSVDMWKSRLQYQIIKDTPSEVDKVFKLGILSLREKALPLWSTTIRYHILTSSDEMIEAIYRDGVKQPREVSSVLKPQYIEWLAFSKSIVAARKAYNLIAEEKPYSKELHFMMSKIESMEIDYNFDAWGHVHTLACKQFGYDVDVWLEYVKFFVFYNKSGDINEHVQKIKKDAEISLSSTLWLEFLTEYNKVMNSI